MILSSSIYNSQKNAIPRHQRRQLALNHPDRREDSCHSKANCTSSGFESRLTGWLVSIWGIPNSIDDPKSDRLLVDEIQHMVACGSRIPVPRCVETPRRCPTVPWGIACGLPLAELPGNAIVWVPYVGFHPLVMAESHTHGDHAPIEDIDRAPTKYEILEQTIRELLIEKDVLTADAIRRQMEDMESRTPEKGAEVVARA